MKSKDERIQEAQDHLRSIAPSGSYLHAIADLMDEMYADAYGHPVVNTVRVKQYYEDAAAKTMKRNALAGAANKFPRD